MPLSAQTTTTWIGPSGGAWSDPANWSTTTAPNATNTAAFSVTPDSDLAISLVGSPSAVTRINASIKIPEGRSYIYGTDSVILGSPQSPDDELTLTSSTSTPAISVSLSTLRFNALLSSSQGFTKLGNGTLSFRDNPRTQSYSGNITLSDGTLEIAADTDLGTPTNSLIVNGTAKIIGNPPDPSTPIELAASRNINVASSFWATLGNSVSTGSLVLNGPLFGAGGVIFNSVGSLTLTGANTITGNWAYAIHPPLPRQARGYQKNIYPDGLIVTYYLPGPTVVAENLAWSSQLKFEGPDSFPRIPPNLSIYTDSGYYLRGSKCDNRIELGNQTRRIRHLSFSASLPWGSTDSSFDTVFANGELIADSATIAVTVSNGDSYAGLSNTLRFDQVPQLTITGSVAVTAQSSRSTVTTNSARLRIGTRAHFNLSSLVIDGDADCRLDAMHPGSTLKIRGNSGLEDSRVPLIRLGYGGNSSNTTSRSLLDLADGSIDIRADRMQILGQGSDYGTTADSTARLSFAAGSLDVSTLELGGVGSLGSLDCSVVQSGGSANVGSLRFRSPFTVSKPPKKMRFAYQLDGGRLVVGSVSADATFSTAGLGRMIDWSTGTLVANNTTTLFNSASALAPLDINLRGDSLKTLEVPATNSAIFGSSTRLHSDSPSTTFSKTGPGTLTLSGDSSNFSGSLQLDEGTLSLGTETSTTSTPLGSLRWNAGAIACDLSALNETSDRLLISRTLTKGPAPASTRLLDLKSSLGIGAYTLATYASTDLTLADFTATGIRPGYSADFTVGPTALTVTLGPDTPHSLWRSTHFSTSANLGPADDLADPDSDGRPNLLEYALASEPTSADSAAPLTLARLPASDSSPARLALTFNRIADPGLTYAVRAASSPSGPWTEVIFTSTGSDNTAGPVTVTDPADLASHPTRFLRLFVTR